MHFTGGSCRSSRSRKRKRQINRRRGRLDEVPNSASNVNIDVSASSLMENPAFGIVCVDDNSHPVNAPNEYSQCNSADPLCVNIKVDPDCLQEVSANTSAVSHHRESSSLLCAETELQLQSKAAGPPPLTIISPSVVSGDTSFQSVLEHDPLQLNDIKVAVERFEAEIDAQIPDIRGISQHHAILVSADSLPREGSHELSTTSQMERPQRLGTTKSDQKAFACTKCSFKANTNIDLSKHHLLHQVKESNRNATQSLTSYSKGNLNSASSVSFPFCTPSELPRKTNVPLVITLDDENSGTEFRSLNIFQNTSSPAVHLQTSVCPASSSNFYVPTAVSSQMATKANQGQFMSARSAQQPDQGHVEDILILPDLPGQDGTSSRSTCQSSVSVNPSPVPLTVCSTNPKFIPNHTLHSPSQTALNEEETRFYSLPHPHCITQLEISGLDSRLLRNRPIDLGMGNQEVPNTFQLPCQPAACSVNNLSKSRQHPVGTFGTTIETSGIPQLVDNNFLNKIPVPPPKPQSQANIFVTPSGSVKEISTVLRQSSAEVSKGLEPPPLVFRTFVMDRSKQSAPIEQNSSDSQAGLPANTSGSPLPSLQPLSTVPRKISVIQQPLRKSSVNHHSPNLTSQHLLNPSHRPSALQSDGDILNKASDRTIISHPLDPSANQSPRILLSKQTASSALQPLCSTDSLRGLSSVQSPTSSILNQPVSKESHEVPRYSESLNVSDNDVQSLTLNQVRSASTVQMQSSAQPNAPLPLISVNPPPLSFLNRIDRLIEVNAQVLNGTPAARKRHPFSVPTKSATSTPENSQSFLRSEQSTQSASLSQNVNLNPSSRIHVEGHLKTNSTASLSCTVSTPVLSCDNASSDDAPRDEIDRGDCILLQKSADLSSGLQKTDNNIAMNIAGPRNCAPSNKAKASRSTYDLRGIPRKSQKTRTSSEKADSSSSESDEYALNDPDYLPQLDLHSDDSDKPDDSNAVPSTIPENTKPLTCAPLFTKPVANTGDKEDCGISRSVSSVSIACLGTPSSASGVSEVACARTQSKGEPMHLDSTQSVSSQTSYKRRDGDVLNLPNLLKSSEQAGLPGPSAAPKSLFSRESIDPSVNQSLLVFSAESSTNASRANNLLFAASAESLPVSSDLVASAFSEAHSLMLANATGSTCAMPITSQCAIPTASSVTEGSISSNYTGIKADASNFETIRTNITNTGLGNRSKPLSLEGLLRNGTNHVLEMSTAVTSKDDSGRGVNLIPTTLETEQNSNCEQPQYRRKNTNEIIGENTKSTESSHTKRQFKSTDSFLETRLPIPAATVESQPERTSTIPELVCSEKSSICCNEGAPTGITSCTGVGSIYSPPRNHASSRDNTEENKQSSNVVSDIATDNVFGDTACKGLYRNNNSPSPNRAASSKDYPEKPQQISSAIDIASDDSSTDVDDPDPKTSLRKRSSSCSSSESGASTMVDPDYVPPSHDKLPLKTPDSVLDEIPTYEHWVRNKFVQDESETDTPKPDNDCCVCQRKFPNHQSLKEHRAERYSDLKCCKCSFKASTERTLKTHTNKHWRTKPYVCEECSQTFWKRGKYVKHFLMHRNDFYYICNICDQGFNDYHPYENHVNKHLNKTPYKCLKCDLAFTSKALLSGHKKRMHKRKAYTECTVCKKSINKFWLADHMKRHEQKDVKKYLCEQCGKEVKSKLSLSRHILKHTGERPHMCKYCGATFKVQGALKQHERKHTGERPFKCEVCGKTFAYNTPYSYHLRTHTGERPYKCEYCGMTFAQPSPYAVHKRLHTGERPYKCKICDDAFPSHAAVRNHMQTHANSENKLKRARKTERKTSKPKKPRKERSASVVDTRSSSDSEKESTEVGVVQPRRRSARQTKCTKSLVEEGSDSGENHK